MIKVTLHGKLGKIFGITHNFSIASGADAYKALRANFEKFESTVMEFAKRDLHYMMIVDGEEIKSTEEFNRLKVVKEVHFVPFIVGAFLGLLILAAKTAFAFIVASPLLSSLVISLIIYGVTSLLFKPANPTPQAATSNTNAGANSYFFGGRANVARQGVPVPVGYGRLKIGSLIVGSSIISSDITDS